MLDASILRLHNVYGPNTDLSPERSQVIPATIRKAIQYPKEDFIIWGNGEQSRAFIYVSDIVDALILSMEKGINKGPIQIGNAKEDAKAFAGYARENEASRTKRSEEVRSKRGASEV